MQTNAPFNAAGLNYYPASLPNPVSMHQGLVIKGNVFVNHHRTYPNMALGLDPCYNTGLPCDTPTVRQSCGSHVSGFCKAVMWISSIWLLQGSHVDLMHLAFERQSCGVYASSY
jgi:hypothetical protein